MQLYKDVLLCQDRHREYVKAAQQDRLGRAAGSRKQSLQSVSRMLMRLVGLFFTL